MNIIILTLAASSLLFGALALYYRRRAVVAEEKLEASTILVTENIDKEVPVTVPPKGDA